MEKAVEEWTSKEEGSIEQKEGGFLVSFPYQIYNQKAFVFRFTFVDVVDNSKYYVACDDNMLVQRIQKKKYDSNEMRRRKEERWRKEYEAIDSNIDNDLWGIYE